MEQDVIYREQLKEETEEKINTVQRHLAILNNKFKLSTNEKEKAKYAASLEAFYDELERYQERYKTIIYKQENESR